MTTQRIAELEAEVMRLREALTTCVCAMQDYQAGIGITEMFDKGERLGRKALALPRDTSALNELVEKVERRTIERCANEIDTTRPVGNDRDTNLRRVQMAIRALPVGQLKLEELL